MKMRVKLLSLALATVMVTSAMLTGCTKSESESVGADSTQANSTQEAANTEKPKQVSIKHYFYMDEASMKNAKIPEIIAEFEKKNPGIKVEAQPLVGNTSADEYTKKQDLMFASGEQMDVVYFKDVQALTSKLSANVIEPLDDMAQKLGVDIKNEYRGIIPFNGKVYAFPSQYSTWVVYLNKDMLDAAGLPIPPADWTWDDYREYAKKLTKGEGKDKVYGSYFHSWSWFNAVGYQNKIVDNPFYKQDGSSNFDHPIFKTGLQLRSDLENVDKTSVPLLDIKTQKMAYRSMFFSGKVAMMPQGTWMLVDIKDKEKYPHTFKTTVATYPRADKDSPANFSNNGGAGCGYGINANSKAKEETFKYLSFLTSEGNEIGKSTLSPWKKTNNEAILSELMGSDASLYDMDALKKILDDPNKKDNDYTVSPPYGVEIDSVFQEESEKYLVGGQSIDDAISNMVKRSNDIIQKNK